MAYCHRSVCRVVCYGQTVQHRPIRMWGRHLNWYHFLPPRSTQTGVRGLTQSGWPLSDNGIPAKWWQIEQNVVLRSVGKSWVDFRFVQISTLNTPITPKIGDPKTYP